MKTDVCARKIQPRRGLKRLGHFTLEGPLRQELQTSERGGTSGTFIDSLNERVWRTIDSGMFLSPRCQSDAVCISKASGRKVECNMGNNESC